MLRYKRINSEFYSETTFFTQTAKSFQGYHMLQLFVSDKGYIAIYLMKENLDILDVLHQCCKEIGVQQQPVVDSLR